jgi:hypothetical protein
MRKLGHFLLWLGFLGAAFVATRQLDRVDWTWYAIAGLVGVAGVVLLRRTATAAASHVDTVRENISALESSLRRLVENLAKLNAERSTLFVYDVHGRIDSDLAEDLASFAEAREAMIHGIGLEEYAHVMDEFARSERAIHRAWSASADGYVDEVWDCLERAEQSMREADRVLASHLGGDLSPAPARG